MTIPLEPPCDKECCVTLRTSYFTLHTSHYLSVRVPTALLREGGGGGGRARRFPYAVSFKLFHTRCAVDRQVIATANGSFANETQYLGTTATHQIVIQEEIDSSLNSGNVRPRPRPCCCCCCHSVRNFLHLRSFSK
jgi:hypothetical protein